MMFLVSLIDVTKLQNSCVGSECVHTVYCYREQSFDAPTCSSGKVDTQSSPIESAHCSGPGETELLARNTYAGYNRGIDFACP